MQKQLPLNKTDFGYIRRNNLLYVDKTQAIHKLTMNGGFYLLARPRGFGKSLLISTLKALFAGNKELFEGLWIYQQKRDWEPYPVIHLPFASMDYTQKGLVNALNEMLIEIAEDHHITLKYRNPAENFQQLIRSIPSKQRAVLLIDDYDKPVWDYSENQQELKANKRILQEFFATVKAYQEQLHFVLFTGQAMFNSCSICKGLDQLTDLTMKREAATLAGITHEELISVFAAHLESFTGWNDSAKTLLSLIRDEYLGYSFDGTTLVYNPFTLISLFHHGEIADYWYQMTPPNKVMRKIRIRNYPFLELENQSLSLDLFSKHSVEQLPLLLLLLQQGYLTINRYNPAQKHLTLNYPNRSVARAFTRDLLLNLSSLKADQADALINLIIQSLQNKETDEFMRFLQKLCRSIDYPIMDLNAHYCHSVFYLIMRVLTFYVEGNIQVKEHFVLVKLFIQKREFILEFATRNHPSAFVHLLDEGFHEHKSKRMRERVLIGINFSVDNRHIKDYEIQTIR